jgi:acyl-CoA synthetase (NDP forming)
VVHKTEAGGVETNLRDDVDVRRAFGDITKSVKKKIPKARIRGILVQKMFEGREVIVGASIDPQFGPVIMFGLGGIFVESLRDVTFRVIPISRNDAKGMIQEIRGYKILQGVRGLKPVNFLALESCLLAVSDMMLGSRNPKIRELDINPLFVNERGVVAVDVRVIVE